MTQIRGGSLGTPAQSYRPQPASTAVPANGARDVSSASLLDELAAQFTDKLLEPRRKYLHHRAPKSRYVHNTRRDLACGKLRAWRVILAVALADIEETDMPAEAVAHTFDLAAATLRARGREVRHDGAAAPSLLPLILRENRRENGENEAEDRVLADEDSVEAIDALLAASALEREEMDRRDNALRQRRAELTLQHVRTS